MKIGLGVTLQASMREDRIVLWVDIPPLTNFTLGIEEENFLWEVFSTNDNSISNNNQ